MKKLLLVKSLLIMVCLLNSNPAVKAQDSAKGAKPIVKPATVKPKQPYAGKTYAKPTNANSQVPVPNGTVTAPAQQPNTVAQQPAESTDKSLNGQYQYVLSKTYHYQQPMIAALWKNINDTLRAVKHSLKEAQTRLIVQTQSISSLQTDIKSKDQAITDVNSKSDAISLLGIYLTKTTYNLIMWGLVICLTVALLIVILRTGGNAREAKYRTKLYDELSEEFQAYKVKSNEKEKKLARELQTERNKVDELMGRG